MSEITSNHTSRHVAILTHHPLDSLQCIQYHILWVPCFKKKLKTEKLYFRWPLLVQSSCSVAPVTTACIHVGWAQRWHTVVHLCSKVITSDIRDQQKQDWTAIWGSLFQLQRTVYMVCYEFMHLQLIPSKQLYCTCTPTGIYMVWGHI